jgi:hypothetical protein
MDAMMADSRYLEAEQLTRRGLESSIQLLEEELRRATARAEYEARLRRETERRAAAAEADLASLRQQASAVLSSAQDYEGDRLNRELLERASAQRVEAALADRAALEVTVQELRTEATVLAQRLEAEGRARTALTQQLVACERETNELRERCAQQQTTTAEHVESMRALELTHREVRLSLSLSRPHSLTLSLSVYL